MRPIYLRWLVISSFALALTAHAATRPHYGGTLRVEASAAITSLDPVQKATDAGVRDSLVPLIFDTLVHMDATGAPQPQLAERWQAENGNKRWQFWLHRPVILHDGSTLLPNDVAHSLMSSLPGYTIRPTTTGVVIESSVPVPGLLAELSRSQNAIVLRDGQTLVGSGPFRIGEFEPGKRLLLRGNDDYWNGRPYLETIEITLGQSVRDQVMHFQLGRADVIELSADIVRRAMQDGRHVVTSSPSELIAIVVPRGTGAAEDPRMREALSLAIDRNTIQNVLLQRQGDATAALLPQWMTGYAFLFPAALDLGRARQLRGQLGANQPAIPLSYDASDPIARSIAERVAVNARDAGIAVQAAPEAPGSTQVPKIVRIRLASSSPQAALAEVIAAIDPSQTSRVLGAHSIDDLYLAERTFLDGFRVIPIAHVSESFLLAQHVRDWMVLREGGLPLDNVWVEGAQ